MLGSLKSTAESEIPCNPKLRFILKLRRSEIPRFWIFVFPNYGISENPTHSVNSHISKFRNSGAQKFHIVENPNFQNSDISVSQKK